MSLASRQIGPIKAPFTSLRTASTCIVLGLTTESGVVDDTAVRACHVQHCWVVFISFRHLSKTEYHPFVGEKSHDVIVYSTQTGLGGEGTTVLSQASE